MAPLGMTRVVTRQVPWCSLTFMALVSAVPGSPAGQDLGIVTPSQPLKLASPLPPTVPGLDVVIVEGKLPTVAWLDQATPMAEPHRPKGNPADLAATLLPLGQDTACTPGTGSSEQPCELIARWTRAPRPVDLLNYTELHLRGHAEQPGTLFILDDRGRRAPLGGTGGGHVRLDVPVTMLAGQIDLRRVAGFAFRPHTPPGGMVITALSATMALPERRARRAGMWLWDYRLAVADPASVIDTCRHAGITRLAIQLPSIDAGEAVWGQYVRLLSELGAHGIEAAALDGAPDVIHDAGWLLDKLHHLQRLAPEGLPLLVQMDIEPYLLPGFFADEQGFERYVATLAQIKQTLQAGHRLSIVIPFWLVDRTLHQRSVLEHVFSVADEVVIMSYRTDLHEVEQSTEETLRYADLFQVPVWLALETTPLPLEHHIELYREPRRDLTNAYVDLTAQTLHFGTPPSTGPYAWFRIHHRYSVRPARLTFAGQTQQAVLRALHTLTDRIPHPSLAGVFIHDFAGFLSLPRTEQP